MKKPIWKLQQKRIEDLIPYEFNPRNITEKGKSELKKSIDKFGLAEPIIINLDNVIIGGHARFFVLLEKGEMFCDCYVPDFLLTPEEMKELNIRLNKNIAGEWDFNILASAFDMPSLIDWGFETNELDSALWNPKTEEELDDVPEPQKEAVSKLGDIFLIDGRHRVMCGDSTDSGQVSELCAGKRAKFVHTDPPYGVDYDGGTKKQKKLENDFDVSIYSKVLPILFLFTEEKAAFFIWYAISQSAAVTAAGFDERKTIVWNKNQAQFGALSAQYKDKYEPCLYLFKKGKTPYWYGPTNEVSVWDIKRSSKNEFHPTQKPIELPIRAINNHTLQNDTVLDLFLGSGSTLIACEQTNRICYGMELDPVYIDVILRRFYKLYPGKRIECLTRKNFNFSDLFND